MRLVSVFDSNNLPDKEMRELVVVEQGNESYRKIWLDDGGRPG